MVAGAFFGGVEARGWLEAGRADLEREIVRQILPDGVDFEASSAYHRLVAELFLLAAIHAEGIQPVSTAYRARLAAAARFCAAYTRPDGSAPLWGDADDARALPLGTAALGDHRHLIACTAAFLGDAQLAAAAAGGGWDEALWLLGAAPPATAMVNAPAVEAFAAGGAYVLRAEAAHVFIDCGAVGLAGRGGHGHNDALSFEAMLGGLAVVSDAGCYQYTASFEERNRFRATAAHNTPQIDEEELNRFLSPELLWLLHDDARPLDARVWEEEGQRRFEGGHTGYRRLPEPVVPWRRIELDAQGRWLRVVDSFRGSGVHAVSIPLQLAPGWSVEELATHAAHCRHASGRGLRVRFAGADAWQLSCAPGRVAPTYGIAVAAPRLVCRARAPVAELILETLLELEDRHG